MELQNNSAAAQNGTAKETINPANNGTAKKDAAQAPKPAAAKAESEKPKAEPAKPETLPAKAPEQTQPAAPELSLDDKLKLVNDLHRKSVQRINLISRIKLLEAFEVNLANEHDELNDNPYQGCKLIIRDDKNRDFITTTPGLIRKVAEYIFSECNQKLSEIESSINFPNR